MIYRPFTLLIILLLLLLLFFSPRCTGILSNPLLNLVHCLEYIQWLIEVIIVVHNIYSRATCVGIIVLNWNISPELPVVGLDPLLHVPQGSSGKFILKVADIF